MKIAHLADTHLGYRALKKQTPDGRNQRAEDVRAAFADATNRICDMQPDLVIHAGDLFDMPRPGWGDIALVIGQFMKIECPICLIAGNHDTATLRTKENVFTVLEQAVPHLYVASGDEQDYVTFFADKSVPVMVNLIASRKLKSDYPPTAIVDPAAINIMVVHGIASDIPGARHAPLPGDEQVPDDLLAKTYDYIAMGDWHQWGQVRNNAWYAGSTERFGWGDVNAEPGWLLVEIEQGAPAVVTHKPISTRPMIDLPALHVAGPDAPEAVAATMLRVLSEVKAPPDAMVRQRLEGVPSHAWFSQVQRLLNRVRGDYPVWAYSTPWAVEGKEAGLAAALTAQIPKLDVMDMFREFVAEKHGKNVSFGALLLKRGTEALEIARQHQLERMATDE